MGIPEEGEDEGGAEIAGNIIKSLMPEIEVQYVVIGRIGKNNSAVPRLLSIKIE